MPESFHKFWEYDSEADQWNHKTDYPGESKSHAISFQTGGKGYVTGGDNENYQYSVQLWEYNPLSDSWLRKNDLPFPLSNVIELSGVAYITDFDGNIYNYDPENDSFHKVTTNNSLAGFKGFGLKGFLYFFEEPLNKVAWKYDVTKNLWSQWDGPFPFSAESDILNFSLDSTGLIIDHGRTYKFTSSD
jgi:N-acetylneuraminic acid mutarotase